MTRKTIIFITLALLCVALFIAWRADQATQATQAEQATQASRPLGATEYGALLALRDVLPPEQFKAEVLPLLQKAASGEAITVQELDALNERLGNIAAQALAAAEKKRPQEELANAWATTKQSASDLGKQMEEGVNEALDQFSRMVDDFTSQQDDPVKEKATDPDKTSRDPMEPMTL